jgi:ribosomal protein S18 acetylase RimI-like enzyme
MDRENWRLFEQFDDASRTAEAPKAALDVIVRPACAADAEAVGRISADREGTDVGAAVTAVERTLNDDGIGRSRVLLVAELDGAVVGFGKIQYREGDAAPVNGELPGGWYLAGVIVDPRFRRRGVGTKLTAARIRWIADRDSAAYYFANARNRVSIALHAAFGFAEIGRAPAFGDVSFVGGEGILFRAELGSPERRAP